MIRIAVCDDEEIELKKISSALDEYKKNYYHDISYYLFSSGTNLLYDVEEGSPYDIVILDIEIGTINGIELANKIMKIDPSTVFVFVTNHEQYVFDSLCVRPCNFLVKPLDNDKFKSTIDNALIFCQTENNFAYSIKGTTYHVPLDDIIYFSSLKRTIIIKTKNNEYVFYDKLDNIMDSLSQKSNLFIRISQSDILNVKYIVSHSYTTINIAVDNIVKQFNISQAYRADVRNKLITLLKY